MAADVRAAMNAARSALHLDVGCPVCGAAFSAPCRTSSGKYRSQVHAPRLKLSASLAAIRLLLGPDFVSRAWQTR